MKRGLKGLRVVVVVKREDDAVGKSEGERKVVLLGDRSIASLLRSELLKMNLTCESRYHSRWMQLMQLMQSKMVMSRGGRG